MYWEKRWVHAFYKGITANEKQPVLSRIWTQDTSSISSDPKRASFIAHEYAHGTLS